MKQLLYVSAATSELTADELTRILAVSRRNNQAAGITGMLLYLDGGFLQVLEGKPGPVEACFARICEDPRHSGVIRLLDEAIEDRDFENWSMGFKEIEDDGSADASDLFRLTDQALHHRLDRDGLEKVRILVSTFYEVATRRPL